MNYHEIPPYLCRKRRPRGPSLDFLLSVLSFVVLIAVLIVSVLMSMDAFPRAHAAERTPQTFCATP